MGYAFVFPGQGSQSVGMLKGFSEQPIVRETFAEASDVLSLDLWQLCQEGPPEEIDKTINTQPALLTAGVAMWRLWDDMAGVKPTLMAGHSLGEWTALVCAQTMTLMDAVKLVRQRGKYMQMAVTDGAMAAILGLSHQVVEEICSQSTKISYVRPANINTHSQIVISGYTKAVENVCEEARQQGAKRAVRLPISVPSHCALMQSAVDLLEEDLKSTELQLPQVTILHNLDAEEVEDVARLKQKLIRQLISPVQWVKTIEAMKDRGIRTIVESGPGRVLSGLNRSIDRELNLHNLEGDMQNIKQVVNALQR